VKLTTKQIKQIIKEELRILLGESEEMEQMSQLISGDDVESVKIGLNQLVIGGVAEMLGVRIVDLISAPNTNNELKSFVRWLKSIVDLKKTYHSKEIVDKSLPDWTEEDIQIYAKKVKGIIEFFWWNLNNTWAMPNSDAEPSFLPDNVRQITDEWTGSYAGDVLLYIADGKKIFSRDHYGSPPRTPRPGEDSFVTGFFTTQEWLDNALSLMRDDEILGEILRELI